MRLQIIFILVCLSFIGAFATRQIVMSPQDGYSNNGSSMFTNVIPPDSFGQTTSNTSTPIDIDATSLEADITADMANHIAIKTNKLYILARDFYDLQIRSLYNLTMNLNVINSNYSNATELAERAFDKVAPQGWGQMAYASIMANESDISTATVRYKTSQALNGVPGVVVNVTEVADTARDVSDTIVNIAYANVYLAKLGIATAETVVALAEVGLRESTKSAALASLEYALKVNATTKRDLDHASDIYKIIALSVNQTQNLTVVGSFNNYLLETSMKTTFEDSDTIVNAIGQIVDVIALVAREIGQNTSRSRVRRLLRRF